MMQIFEFLQLNDVYVEMKLDPEQRKKKKSNKQEMYVFDRFFYFLGADFRFEYFRSEVSCINRFS